MSILAISRRTPALAFGSVEVCYDRIVVPNWKRAVSADDEAELNRLRGMSTNERSALFAELQDLMVGVIRHREDLKSLLSERVPLPSGWLELARAARRA